MDGNVITDSGLRSIPRPVRKFESGVAECADLSLVDLIQRGVQLRHKKDGFAIENKPGLKVIEENAPPRRDISMMRSRARYRTQLRRNDMNCSSLQTLANPGGNSHTRATSPSYVARPANITSFSPTSKKRFRRCPLRIEELAQPNKRHCIENLRDNYQILPIHMLDRLKQQVTNQKILAGIPEAINCFKIRKSRQSSSGSETRRRKLRNMNKISQELDEIRLMSAIFCHQVARKLMKPINIYLSDELQRISTIVTDELKQITQSKRLCPSYARDKGILNEMSGKIALWISDILSEARFKLLEDELRAQKTHENKLGKEGDLVTLIDQYVPKQQLHADLEEEEGPALDALDSLVDNVLDICVAKSDSLDKESPNKEDEYVSFPKDDNLDSKVTIPDKESKDDLMQYLTDQIDKEQTIEVKEVNEEHANILDVNKAYEIPENLKQDSNYEDSDSNYGSTVDLNSNADDENKNLVYTVDDEENAKVSEVHDTLDEPLDDRKKVKFSQPKHGNGTVGAGEFGEAGRNESREKRPGSGAYGAGGAGADEPERKVKSNESLEKWPNYSLSATRIKSDIVFQPPNPSILCEVDESWPDEFAIPMLKPSESVSKSVTSLGNINELEEPENEGYDRHGKIFKDVKANKTSLGGRLLNMHLIEQDQTSTTRSEITDYTSKTYSKEVRSNVTYAINHVEDLSRAPEQWSSTCTTDSQSNIKISPSNLLNDLRNLIEAEQAAKSKEVIKREDYRPSGSDNFKHDGKGDNVQKAEQDDTESEKNPIVEAIKKKLRNESNLKFDYRVRPLSAPSWALNSHSEDSVPVMKKKKRLGQYEIRKWCKDIENTLINLQHWNNWLNITCKSIRYMKQHTAASSRYGPYAYKYNLREWIKLKKKIDNDAILWRKLNHRTYEVLKTHYDPYGTKLERKAKSPIMRKLMAANKESISNEMVSIERMSLLLHRQIVSTEHDVKCDCTAIMLKKLRKN